MAATKILNVDVSEIFNLIEAQGVKIMALTKIVSDFSARVEPAIGELDAKIKALKALINAGTYTPEDAAKLTAIADALDNLKNI